MQNDTHDNSASPIPSVNAFLALPKQDDLRRWMLACSAASWKRLWSGRVVGEGRFQRIARGALSKTQM